MTPAGLELIQDMKKLIDPKNIFAVNNTIYREEGEEEADLVHSGGKKY